MLGLAINLLGIKKAIGSALTWATANATRMLAIALALALAWGAIERHGKHKAQKVLASTEQAYRNAQKDAKLAQEALNSSISARYRAEAEKTDHGYQKARAGALSRADSYIRANRVQPCVASPSRRSDSAAESGFTQGGDGADQPAILVSVRPDDIRICTDNTERLAAVREWGQSMIDAGLAEAGD